MEPVDRQRHLLSVADLGRDGIIELMRLTDSCMAIGERSIPKVPALRGKTVATVFFEASTRTRLSFETAAKRLSADTMTFNVSNSSLEKGESLRDTVETIDAMGVDVMVVRHSAAGAAEQIARWVSASVVNAGDGAHEHPTQALTDCFTIRSALSERTGVQVDDLSSLRIAIVGDIRHSRVARSNVLAFTALGAHVTIVGPSTLLPSNVEDWPCEVTTDFDAVLGDVDVLYILRLQSERMREALIPSLAEYRDRYGLTQKRASEKKPDAMILHPGPMNRGVEIDAQVAMSPSSYITRQVKNGVAVRMAVLFSLLGMTSALSAPSVIAEEVTPPFVEQLSGQRA